MTFVKANLVRKGDTVIECGAHHGAGTILLSRWVGDNGKVIVLEPVPDNLAILRRNIEIDKLKNVIEVPKAAGNSSGHVIMSRNSNAAVTTRRHGARSALEVECVTLDSIVRDLGVVPDLVKIDVEGYEYRVLEGCKSILASVPALFVEVHTLTLLYDHFQSGGGQQRAGALRSGRPLNRSNAFVSEAEGADPSGRGCVRSRWFLIERGRDRGLSEPTDLSWLSPLP